ncbi:MAG TPA: hypothetical protein VES91_06570, partial [Burkholderiaceae bacterium]|nr:hypothetical protein [Burkholderiaceae bacterium]
VDLSLRQKDKRGNWDLTFTIHNVFDTDAREPSPNGAPFVSIPNDIPLPGRWYLLQARYEL